MNGEFYPEHDKLKLVEDKFGLLADFLETCDGELYEYSYSRCDGEEYERMNNEEQICKFLHIDYAKLTAEKTRMNILRDAKVAS